MLCGEETFSSQFVSPTQPFTTSGRWGHLGSSSRKNVSHVGAGGDYSIDYSNFANGACVASDGSSIFPIKKIYLFKFRFFNRVRFLL